MADQVRYSSLNGANRAIELRRLSFSFLEESRRCRPSRLAKANLGTPTVSNLVYFVPLRVQSGILRILRILRILFTEGTRLDTVALVFSLKVKIGQAFPSRFSGLDVLCGQS